MNKIIKCAYCSVEYFEGVSCPHCVLQNELTSMSKHSVERSIKAIENALEELKIQYGISLPPKQKTLAFKMGEQIMGCKTRWYAEGYADRHMKPVTAIYAENKKELIEKCEKLTEAIGCKCEIDR